MIRPVALALLAIAFATLPACPPVEEEATDAGPAGDGGAPPEPKGPLNKGLQLTVCRGGGGAPDVSGTWAFLLETASAIEVDGRAPQAEIVARVGVAQLCQQVQQVRGRFLVCDLAQSPVLDRSNTCAAQRPSRNLVEALPVVEVDGAVDRLGPAATLFFPGWRESWGLRAGHRIEDGATTVIDALVVDEDADGDPGVTLRGDGDVPTVAWAVRQTRADLSVEVDFRRLDGFTRAATTEVIVGGPAARVLAGRTRDVADGALTMVRVDGAGGTAQVDANGDGQITCAELERVRALLPAPTAVGCR
ncbi:MAG: hypothetical protein KC583_05025 [Myxococcales bacterium]|nr:hypothetical protein [Myxococcales bacterium]